MERRRVVVTGMGCVTPIGLDVSQSWESAKAGVCGIAPITAYDTADMKVKLAAEVKGFQPEQYIEKREVRKLDRFSQLALAAASQAMEQSGLGAEQADPYRCGVSVSSGIGGLPTLQLGCLKGEERGYDKVSPYFIPMIIGNMAGAQIAIRYGLRGMATCPTTACAGGTNAIGDAFRSIRDGYAEVMVCGGAESCITTLGMGGFTSMQALSVSEDPGRASIPFDRERNGFVMGEGAGILVLEELEHARARGAGILGEVVVYGATCDAYHMTAPAPDGAPGARAMELALEDGGVAPEEVGYINAHGTSTPMNDKCETMAVRAAFGPQADKLAMSSTKSMTGHLLGAAGGVEAIFTLLALREGFLPPTVGYQVPDPDCDLDIVPNVGRRAEIRYAMSNSLGFGGHNASILLCRWEG